MDDFSVAELRIRVATSAWSEPETSDGYRLVLVRRGVFRARVGGRVMLADPAVAYFGAPGEEQSIAHRVGALDLCTALVASQGFMAELGQPPSGGRPVPVTGEVAVAHRLLARGGVDSFALTELAVRVVGGLLTTGPDAPGAARASTEVARRRLVEEARELLATDPRGLGLRTVARRVGCSPHHLSRVFRHETGMTLTRYRSRIRVLAALEAIEAGENDLAGLAADLGFADHAHLTRTVRQECGRTPRALRALLAPN